MTATGGIIYYKNGFAGPMMSAEELLHSWHIDEQYSDNCFIKSWIFPEKQIVTFTTIIWIFAADSYHSVAEYPPILRLP